jgi:hypothetical protein
MSAKRKTVALVTPLLAQRGFRKRAGGIFTTELANGALGWVGLNSASRHYPAGSVEINPVVGIRNQEVERVVAEVRGERFHEYVPPTLSTPLGYLFPEARYRSWIFGADDSLTAATEMVEAIADYGVPFMQRLSSLPELCRGLEKSSGLEHQLVYRRPVARMLLGELVKAREVLDQSLAALGDRRDPAAEELRRFGEALRERLAKTTSGR